MSDIQRTPKLCYVCLAATLTVRDICGRSILNFYLATFIISFY